MRVTIPHTIQLRHPITSDEGKILTSELVLDSRPTAKTMKPLLASFLGAGLGPSAGLDENALFKVLAAAFRVEPWVIDNLDMADFLEAVEVLMDFLPAGPGAGEAPSASSRRS